MAEVSLEVETPTNEFLGMNPTALVNTLWDQKAQIKAINQELENAKRIGKQIEEALLIHQHNNPTSKKIGTDTATVTFSDETFYSVTDWNNLYDYITENNAFHLLQRRLNGTPVRELFALGTELPFVDSFTRKKVGIRKA